MEIETKTLYEQDFYWWIETTVKLLQEGRWTEIERENLIEELISMGRSEKRQLSSRIITGFRTFAKVSLLGTRERL